MGKGVGRGGVGEQKGVGGGTGGTDIGYVHIKAALSCVGGSIMNLRMEESGSLPTQPYDNVDERTPGPQGYRVRVTQKASAF